MRTHQLLKWVLLVLILGFPVCAANITGDWKATLETPGGTVQVSYMFKQDGDILTGTWQAAQSPTVALTEGKVTGDKVTFVVKPGGEKGPVFAHEGTIKGDEIQLTMKPFGEFPGSTLVAKKVKP